MARPDPIAILGDLKDFQRRTAEYAFDRLYGADDPTRRFLVADEVGLGKTLVAKGVVALAVDKLWDTTKRIDIVYICSNAAIARQNINRLNITDTKDFSLASRITLLPVLMGDLGNRKVNFISFTPATSFDLRSSLGMIDERALLCVLLERIWGIKGAGPKNGLQGTAGVERFRDRIKAYRDRDLEPSVVDGYRATLDARIAADRAAGRVDLRARYEDLCGRFARAGDRRNRPAEDLELQVELVGEFRLLLAQSCLKSLEPDLIILDEFQRFKHLLDAEDEESCLARDLFDYSDHESHARVLLLSATPYKMFTGSDEAGGEDHYSDFVATLRFLQADEARTERCEAILRGYRSELLRLGSEASGQLHNLKDQLEAELRRVMVRTERLAATSDRDGMLWQVPAPPLTVTMDDAMTYRGLGRVADHLNQPDPVEYWKSSPYLLSFMEDYQLKAQLRHAEEDPTRARDMAGALRAHRLLALPWNEIAAYERVDPGNARMRWLMDRVIGSGAWRLLWVPPSRPWYRLAGPFADLALEGFTKTLVFSSWNVVPKAIATMVSYAAEREMMRADGGASENTPEARARFSPLLRFARDSGSTLMALIYPSFALARLGAEAQRANGAGLVPLEDVLLDLEARIRPLLDRLPASSAGREDESWYWAAPALLDLVDAEPPTLAWLEDPTLALRRQGDEDDEDSAGVFAEVHVPALRAVIDSRGATLGAKPADLYRILAELAVAGPAVAAVRSLSGLAGGVLEPTDLDLRRFAGQVGYAVRNYFNLPEVTALVRAGRPDVPYWRQVLRYAAEGGLGAVLEEYGHVMYEWLGVTRQSPRDAAAEVAAAMVEALTLRAANPIVDDVVATADGVGFSIEPRRMRTRFAARLGEEVSEGGDERTRLDQVRKGVQ